MSAAQEIGKVGAISAQVGTKKSVLLRWAQKLVLLRWAQKIICARVGSEK